MKTVFPLPVQSLVPIYGSNSVFPVRRIYCIGRNYADHVLEMGNDPKTEPPLFFMKPTDAILTSGKFPYPPMSSDVHHELELVVALKDKGSIFGYAVGIDMTRRDLQTIAKKGGRPWEASKAFDHSAPIGEIMPIEMSGKLSNGKMTLDVNGDRRQTSSLSEMIWSVEEIIAELSRYFELKAGDLIFTGTPSGVGPVRLGDRIHAVIERLSAVELEVVRAARCNNC